MQRREFLSLGASIAGCWAATQVTHALPGKTPIIDTHIHLFDPSRPGGIPWPEKTDTALYKAALPGRYARIARPFGVVGAVVVEAAKYAPLADVFRSTLELSYPVALADLPALEQSSGLGEVRSVPTVLVLNGEGREIVRKFGVCTVSELESWVSRAERP